MKAFAYGAIIAALVALANAISYNDVQLDRAMYCENVQRGLWPDEKNICKSIDSSK